jgi:hypothetical protein
MNNTFPWSMVVLAIAMSILVHAAGAQPREYNLVYKMKVGEVHDFDLVTEQHVVGRRAVRVATDMRIDVMDKDNLGNYDCRMTLSIDRDSTDMRESAQDLSSGAFRHAGKRQYSRVDGYDAVINDVGKIVLGQTVQPHNFDQRGFSLSSQTTDVSMTERPIAPYEVNFTLSSAPGESPLKIGVPYEDTILVISTVQRVTRTIGHVTSPQNEPPPNMDTLLRVMTLDSVLDVGGRQIGHITSLGVKHTILGEHYDITTRYYRDMTTGLIDSLHEVCYAVSASGRRRLEYVTVGRRRSANAYGPMTTTLSPR